MTFVYMHVFQSVIFVDRLCPEILSTFIKEKALHCKGVSFCSIFSNKKKKMGRITVLVVVVILLGRHASARFQGANLEP